MRDSQTGQNGINLTGQSIMTLLASALKEGTIKAEHVMNLLPQTLLNHASDFFTFPPTPIEVTDLQVTRLINLGYKAELFDKRPSPQQNNALLIIPSALVPLAEQMEILGVDAEREDIWKQFESLGPPPETLSRKPYWIYNLNWATFGANDTNVSLKKSLNQRGQRGFNFLEGLHLYAQFPRFFFRGSRSIALLGYDENNFGTPLISIGSQTDYYNKKIIPNCYYGNKGNFDVVPICSIK